MAKFPKLNFPRYAFRMRSGEGSDRIWDELRKIWLVLTPEEWVRRHTVRWLVEEQGVPSAMIAQECSVSVQGQPQRADVVVYGSDARPLLLIECKESNVDISPKTSPQVYAQAVRYNAVTGAKYIMITNGLKHYIYERISEGEYLPLKEFPALG